MKDLFLRGQLQEGTYNDELNGIDPTLIQRYFSVDRPYTFVDPDQYGAGHSDNGAVITKMLPQSC